VSRASSLEALLGAVRDELRLLIVHDTAAVGGPVQRLASVELKIATARREHLQAEMAAYLKGGR